MLLHVYTRSLEFYANTEILMILRHTWILTKTYRTRWSCCVRFHPSRRTTKNTPNSLRKGTPLKTLICERFPANSPIPSKVVPTERTENSLLSYIYIVWGHSAMLSAHLGLDPKRAACAYISVFTMFGVTNSGTRERHSAMRSSRGVRCCTLCLF